MPLTSHRNFTPLPLRLNYAIKLCDFDFKDLIHSFKCNPRRWYRKNARDQDQVTELLDAVYESISVEVVEYAKKKKPYALSIKRLAYPLGMLGPDEISALLLNRRYGDHPGSDYISFDPASLTLAISDTTGYVDALGIII